MEDLIVDSPLSTLGDVVTELPDEEECVDIEAVTFPEDAQEDAQSVSAEEKKNEEAEEPEKKKELNSVQIGKSSLKEYVKALAGMLYLGGIEVYNQSLEPTAAIDSVFASAVKSMTRGDPDANISKICQLIYIHQYMLIDNLKKIHSADILSKIQKDSIPFCKVDENSFNEAADEDCSEMMNGYCKLLYDDVRLACVCEQLEVSEFLKQKGENWRSAEDQECDTQLQELETEIRSMVERMMVLSTDLASPENETRSGPNTPASANLQNGIKLAEVESIMMPRTQLKIVVNDELS